MQRYIGDEHLAHHPSWHLDESQWKTHHVLRMLERNTIVPRTVADVGCGVGEVLRLLQMELDQRAECWGFDVSPRAIQVGRQRENSHLHFQVADVPPDDKVFDLALVLDVIEHVENCHAFLRKLQPRANHKIFQVPLDLSVQTVARAGNLSRQRHEHGHIHYFTKELVIELLQDTGYDVVDFFYTSPALELASRSPKNRALRPARMLATAVNEDLGVRLLGGYRLMVLAK